jgi:hypothetical protein
VSAEEAAPPWIADIVRDIEDGFKRYHFGVNAKPPNAVAILDGVLEQLCAAIFFLENTIDGAEEILTPLHELRNALIEHHEGRRPDLLKPVNADRDRGRIPGLPVKETTKRTFVLTLKELYSLSGRKDPTAQAARAFWLSVSTVKNWSNRMDPILKALVNDRVKVWLGRHSGDPCAAAEKMEKSVTIKKNALTSKKVQ